MRAPAAQLRFLRHREVRAPEAPRPTAADGRPAGAPGRPQFVSMWWVAAGCLVVSALTLILPSTPTYDPWGWILWGREIAHLDLVTTGGPSWKPLPVLFTIPFSLLPLHVAPYLWLWIARAGGLLACVVAYRLARRLMGNDWYGVLAGVLAALALFSSFKFVRDAALGNSEALMAGLIGWGFERHLDGRRDHALYLGVASALLRPEVWPFLGAYGVWLWFKEPRLRVRMVVLGLLVPALWFLPEWWGSGQPLRAGSRASNPNPGSAAFAHDPALELLKRFRKVVIAPVKAGVFISVGLAAYGWLRARRPQDGLTLLVAATGVVWFVLVAVMTQAGFAGNQRYLIVSTMAVSILGGIGAAQVLQGVAALGGRAFKSPRSETVTAVATCFLALLVSAPFINQKWNNVGRVAGGLDHEAELWHDLKVLLKRDGGRHRLLACGGVFSGPFQTQMIAYELGIHGIRIGWRGTPPPGVVFRARTVPNGPLVVKPTDDRYRFVDRYGKWRLLTVPPTSGGPCPKASPYAPTAPLAKVH